MSNPRWSNGAKMRKVREQFRYANAPCGICHGARGPIHYDEPSNHLHPLSFVVDHVHPVGRWREFGYESKQQAAQDVRNMQAAHYICNAQKSDGRKKGEPHAQRKPDPVIGDW